MTTDLVETILAAVTDVDNFDNFRNQTLIEQVTLAQLRLEIGTTSKDETGHVDLV